MRRLAVVATAAVAVVAAACTGGGDPGLTVFAASSLTDAATALGDAFGQRRDVPVSVATAGSQQLARQLLDGADADVFLSADDEEMAAVADGRGLIGEPATVATTRLVIARSTSGPRIAALEDLTTSAVTVALAAPEVPLGGYTRQLLRTRGIQIDPVTLEPSARATLTRVRLGEVDAAVVYAADVAAAGDAVTAVETPDSPVVAYPGGILADTPRPALARDLLRFIRSPEGARILADHGLGRP